MAQNASFNTFFRYWIIAGILTLVAAGIWSINTLFATTPDLILTTVIGILFAFGGAGALTLASKKAGVFTPSK